MTDLSSADSRRVDDTAWHIGQSLLAAYAAGDIGGAIAWSAEAHLAGCAPCRSELSAHVDAERLARNRAVLMARAAIGHGSRAGLTVHLDLLAIQKQPCGLWL